MNASCFRRRGLWCTVCAVLLGALAASGMGRAIEGEDDARLERDQAQIFDRLTSLRTLMERLAQRYSEQGREYKANLLTTAITELIDRDLEGRKEELLRMMRDGDLQVVERQEAFLKDLQAVYQLLLDQQDLDKLDRELDEIRSALNNLGDLQNAEREVREEAESLSGSEVRNLESLVSELEGALDRQSQLETETADREAQAKAEGDASLSQAAREVEDLVERQEDVVDALRAEENERTGRARDRLERAREAAASDDPAAMEQAARLLEETLNEWTPEQDSDVRDALQKAEGALRRAAERARDENASSPSDAAERSDASSEDESTSEEGEATEGEESGAERTGDQREGSQGASESATSEKGGPEKGGQESSSESAKPRGEQDRELDEALTDAEEKVAEALAPDEDFDYAAQSRAEEELRENAERVASDLDALSQKQPEGSDARNSLESARDALKQASDQLEQAGQELAESDLAKANDQAKEALDSLRDALDDVSEEDRRRAEEDAAAARRQDFVRGMTDKARQQVAAQRPGESSAMTPERSQALQEALRKASDAMKQSSQQMSKGEPSQGSQQEASESLDQALQQAKEALEEARENAGDNQPTQEDFDRLAARQQEVVEETRRLMQRLKDLARQRGTEPLDRAARAMDRAKRSFEEGDAQEGEQAAAEAERHLDEARDELEEEEERYENLRQEEVLYRVKEKLTELRDRTVAARDDLAELHRERGDSDRLPRRLRPKVAAVSQEVESIRTGNEEGRETLVEDSSPIFPWILEKNTEDLDRVAEELGARYPDTGEFSQFLLADVVTRYERLLKALDEDMQKRQEESEQEPQEPQEPQDPNQPEPENRLIPTMAELVLLKQLQEQMIEDINVFRAEPLDTLDEGSQSVRRRMLERLGHQQEDLFQLFDKLLEAQGADVEALDDA